MPTPDRRDLLRGLTREAVDAGTYGEPAPAQADTDGRGTCRPGCCGRPLSTRRVVLITPDGTDMRPCGPYCDPCTDALVRDLMPSYTGGRPAYRVEETP